MKNHKKNLLCFGTGYSAKAVANLIFNDGRYNDWLVYGSYRDEAQAKVLAEAGIIPTNFKNAAHILKNANALLSSIPPGKESDPVLEQYGDLLSQISENIWIGYFSTTGVYGDTKGKLADETTPVNPTNERSQRRVLAEKDWLKYEAHIFRLPGIYGPGRSSFDKLKRGISRRIYYPNHRVSRVHVDDIAQSIVASINRPNPRSIYNVCDDEAAEQQLVEAYASELLGVEAPPLVPFKDAINEMSPMTQSFWRDNRRVSNLKIKSELGVNLLYPTFREGLKAIYQATKDTYEAI